MGKYTLIITEKPDAASRIASALAADGKTKKIVENGVPYYMAKRSENIVAKYDLWRKALKIFWKEYLSEIKQNSLTGKWAKEIVNYLASNEGIRSVKES